MPQVINTNLASINAQRNLDKSQTASQTAMQRLSSGLRINSAKDDAAGLAISTRFTSQIKGLNVAVRNAGDGIALAQTAEGALGAMNDNLQRIRELAVQSANATNSGVDREALQAEVKQLIAEVSRTADETNFNGRKLLNGDFNAVFQVGANAGETINVNIANLTAGKLGSSAQSGVSSIGADKALSNGDLVINGKTIDPSSAVDDTASTVAADASAIAKAAAVNKKSAETGVTAYVNKNTVNGSIMAAGATSGTIKINGVSIAIQSTANANDVDKAATRTSVIAAINAVSGQTGVVASDGGNNNGVILTAADGRNIALEATFAAGSTNLAKFGLAQAATTGAVPAALTGTSAGIYEGGFTLVAHGDTKSIKIDGGYGTGTGDLKNSGLTRGDYKPAMANYTNEAKTVTASATATAAAAAGAIQEGDLVVNGVTISASSAADDNSSSTIADSSDASASGIAIAAAINRSTEQTGVIASVNATEVVGTSGAAATAGTSAKVFINGVDVGTVTSVGDKNKDRASAIDLINSKAGQTGVTAEDNGNGITLKAADGRNVSVVVGSGANLRASFGLGGTSIAQSGAANTLANFASNAVTTYSTVRLESATTINITGGSKGTTGLSDSGFERGEYGNGKDGQFLKDVDISTVEGATKALTAIDNAIGTVSRQRADLGAVQNRMSSTVGNLKVNSENLSAANSRIQDADFAAETAEMARTQILQQAGISILAQANASGQNVLSLLG